MHTQACTCINCTHFLRTASLSLLEEVSSFWSCLSLVRDSWPCSWAELVAAPSSSDSCSTLPRVSLNSRSISRTARCMRLFSLWSSSTCSDSQTHTHTHTHTHSDYHEKRLTYKSTCRANTIVRSVFKRICSANAIVRSVLQQEHIHCLY